MNAIQISYLTPFDTVLVIFELLTMFMIGVVVGILIAPAIEREAKDEKA